MKLGGGREYKGQKIDHAAGLRLYIRLNSRIKKGDKIASLYCSDSKKFAEAENIVRSLYSVSRSKKVSDKLIYAYVDENTRMYL
jgi:pyrimidine-nucleoside phosphorylase